MNTIGRDNKCKIDVNRDNPISITIKPRASEDVTVRDIEASRLMIIDLLLEYVGNDGSRGRLVYDLGISCPGSHFHRHQHSYSRAVQTNDPFGEDARVCFMTILPLPGFRQGIQLNTRLYNANFQRRLRQEAGSHIKVIGNAGSQEIPCRFCDPYVAVMGSSVEGIDRAVRMIEAELAA